MAHKNYPARKQRLFSESLTLKEEVSIIKAVK